MTHTHKRGKKKPVSSETELKSLLNQCGEIIEHSIPLLSKEEKEHAKEVLAKSEKALGIKFQRVLVHVEEVMVKALDVTIPEWDASQLIILPLHSIPGDIRSILSKGTKFYVHINIKAKDSSELVFKDFEPPL